MKHGRFSSHFHSQKKNLQNGTALFPCGINGSLNISKFMISQKEKDQLLASGIEVNDERITDIDAAVFAASLTSKASFFEAQASLNKLVDINSEIAKEGVIAANNAEASATTILIISIIAGIIVAIVLGLLISKNIQSIIKSIVYEVKGLAQAATEGKLRYTWGNPEQIDFEFREIIVGANQMLDAVIGPLNVAAEYVDSISQGDIPPRITDNYNGDFNEIKNNLNQGIDAINALVADANMLSQRRWKVNWPPGPMLQGTG